MSLRTQSGSRDAKNAPVFGTVDVWETWQALLAPRRLSAILVVAVPLILVQHELSASPWGWPLLILGVTAMIMIAPVAYRVLLADGLPRTSLPRRLVAYGLLGGVAPLTLYVLPRLLGLPAFTSTSPTVFISAGLLWVAGYGLGRDIDLETRWQRTHRRAQLLAARAEQAQLMALRAQLDPHFLFNTLNAIAEWCREDPEVAERALVDLSALLRQVLLGVRSATWPLEDELNAVRRLFELHRIRDPGRFDVRWTVRVVGCAVPPMLLLPLAENAMTHGPARGHRGPIEVEVRPEGPLTVFTLSNPGRFSGRRADGEGLAMTERRLALACGAAASLRIEGVGDRTRVEVRWPGTAPVAPCAR